MICFAIMSQPLQVHMTYILMVMDMRVYVLLLIPNVSVFPFARCCYSNRFTPNCSGCIFLRAMQERNKQLNILPKHFSSQTD